MTTVLVLDDDADIRESLSFVLEEEGYEVASYGRGEQALDYLRQQNAPHVIITDYLMPGMMGDEFLRRARTELLPIEHCYILMAARPSALLPADIVTLLAEWNISHVQKPFDIDTLLTAVSLCMMSLQ